MAGSWRGGLAPEPRYATRASVWETDGRRGSRPDSASGSEQPNRPRMARGVSFSLEIGTRGTLAIPKRQERRVRPARASARPGRASSPVPLSAGWRSSVPRRSHKPEARVQIPYPPRCAVKRLDTRSHATLSVAWLRRPRAGGSAILRLTHFRTARHLVSWSNWQLTRLSTGRSRVRIPSRLRKSFPSLHGCGERERSPRRSRTKGETVMLKSV